MCLDISVGPTVSSMTLTLQLVGGISAASPLPAAVILPALTMAVSIWFLIFGLLGLGFLFDLLPVYICIAVVLAMSIIVTTLQLPVLLGLVGIPNVFTAIIPATIGNITSVSGRTIAVTISTLVFLIVLGKLKGKWGKEKSMRGKISRGAVASGALFVFLLFAVVSMFFLKDLPMQDQLAPFIPPMGAAPPAAAGNSTGGVVARADAAPGAPPPLPKLPFWPVFPEFLTAIPTAQLPLFSLATSLLMPSFLLFMVINIEHIVVARFFAHENGYAVSKSQEMFSLGVINLVNSFFGGAPVGGGDMTRASVLGYTGVKSPLNQVFTSTTVIVSMSMASGGLRFVPQAVLAAVTMVAVVDQMPPQALMGVFFKLSFADFVTFFLVMNAAIPAPTGLNFSLSTALGVVFLVVYHLFRVMFKNPKVIKSEDVNALLESRYEDSWIDNDVIPPSTLVMKPDGDIIFSNAERMRRYILDAAYLNNSGKTGENEDKSEQTWDNPVDSYVKSIRKQNGAGDSTGDVVFRPRLRMVILDMTSTTFLDSAALMSLEVLKKQLRSWAGDSLEFRFVGLNKHLKRRFERAGWHVVDPSGPQVTFEGDDQTRDFAFDTLPQAVRYLSQEGSSNSPFERMMGIGKDMDNDMEKGMDYDDIGKAKSRDY